MAESDESESESELGAKSVAVVTLTTSGMYVGLRFEGTRTLSAGFGIWAG